jgi:hypothetical protein
LRPSHDCDQEWDKDRNAEHRNRGTEYDERQCCAPDHNDCDDTET